MLCCLLVLQEIIFVLIILRKEFYLPVLPISSTPFPNFLAMEPREPR